MQVNFLTQEATPIPLALELSGMIADEAARRQLFLAYQVRQAEATRRQQQITLAAFRDFLTGAAADPGDLYADPDSWAAITWGLVAGFVRTQLTDGYAVATVNTRLATLKRYAALALQAGTLPHQEYVVIKTLSGYSHREGRNLDRQRKAAGVSTRRGNKAAAPILLTEEQITSLKRQPDTLLGRRDALLICLLLDHGLRCSEATGLRVEDFDLDAGQMTFYRPKVDLVQTHALTADTLAAAASYLALVGDSGPLLRRSSQGLLLDQGISERGLNKRVGELGNLVGIEGLSPHDCRHTWATRAARAGTGILELQQAGGWSSLAMPRRYVEAARVANAGVRLR